MVLWWVETTHLPVSAHDKLLFPPPGFVLLSPLGAQSSEGASVTEALNTAKALSFCGGMRERAMALRVLVDSQKSFARKVTLRILLIALILTALHFLFVLLGDSPCTGHACVPNQHQGYGVDILGQGLALSSSSFVSDALKPRYNFKSYEEYLQLQVKKTLNPKLRKLWTSKDWRRKVDVFVRVFQDFMRQNILKSGDRALCIAARVGQEVLALKEVGVEDSVGVDLVPSPPLVVQGDMHRLPFDSEIFDFEFSNAFDHALFPAMFAAEVERTLKPGGVVVLHLALNKRTDKYSANDLYDISPLLVLFKNFDLVHIKEVDAFGLDTEVVLRKHLSDDGGIKFIKDDLKCPSTRVKEDVIGNAEPLITEEPLKPWLAFKENANKIQYLPSFFDISNHHRHIYIDIGARSYSSSIGSWFVKQYPKQNKNFTIYAVEADKSFARGYAKRKNVQLLPYAAWVRNESLFFGANSENRAAEGEIGMGRIQRQTSIITVTDSGDGIDGSRPSSQSELQTVQGFDFAEWLKKTVTYEDFVVVKMDIEGTEFDLLPRLFETGAICLVDELFLECHYNRWQRTSPDRTSKYNKTYKECLSLFEALRRNGVLVHQWW